MGAPQKVLTVAPASWGPALAAILAPSCSVPGDLHSIGAQVESGQAVAFAVDDGGGIVAAFVLRVDGSEGVVVAAAGALGHESLISLLLPGIEARFVGCSAIRFHTERPGLARVMEKFGYVGQEVVMRKELNYGR